MKNDIFYTIIDNIKVSDYPAGFRKENADALCDVFSGIGSMSADDSKILSMRVLGYWGRELGGIQFKFPEKSKMKEFHFDIIKITTEGLYKCFQRYNPELLLENIQNLAVQCLLNILKTNKSCYITRSDMALTKLRNLKIRHERTQGLTARQLMVKYSLSCSQIYSILDEEGACQYKRKS